MHIRCALQRAGFKKVKRENHEVEIASLLLNTGIQSKPMTTALSFCSSPSLTFLVFFSTKKMREKNDLRFSRCGDRPVRSMLQCPAACKLSYMRLHVSEMNMAFYVGVSCACARV